MNDVDELKKICSDVEWHSIERDNGILYTGRLVINSKSYHGKVWSQYAMPLRSVALSIISNIFTEWREENIK